jgi:hypothetical protein
VPHHPCDQAPQGRDGAELRRRARAIRALRSVEMKIAWPALDNAGLFRPRGRTHVVQG